MDAIDALGASSATTSSGLSSLSPDEFLRIVMTELANQDPLQPNDTSALLEQLSTIRSIQSDTELVDRLNEVVDQNEFASGAALIGRSVSGLNESSQRVTALVRSVSRTSEGVVLNLQGGHRVRMRDADEIVERAA